jgi:hypothetical protein
MNATMVMAGQAATALGGVIWGLAANDAGVVPTFLGGAGVALLGMIIVRVVPALQISIDFTKSVSFESAPVTLFAQSLDPSRLPALLICLICSTPTFLNQPGAEWYTQITRTKSP